MLCETDFALTNPSTLRCPRSFTLHQSPRPSPQSPEHTLTHVYPLPPHITLFKAEKWRLLCVWPSFIASRRQKTILRFILPSHRVPRGSATTRLRTFRLRHFVYRHFVYRHFVYYCMPAYRTVIHPTFVSANHYFHQFQLLLTL